MINIAIKLATSITYTADGSQTNFSVPFDYLRPSFVHVAVNDAEVSEGFTISNRMVMFDSAPAKDAVVHIYRNTPTTRLVSWADASILKAIDMTIAEVQQLHILEEANDWSKTHSIVFDEERGVWQGRNYRVSNVADPTEAQDVVTKNYLENTEDSFVQRMNAIKTQTEQFANTAGNSKDSAYKSAQSASVSAASAAESTKLAEGYKNIAETAKSDASLYAANAKTSADNAGASKEAAQSAATTASNFASAARNSAGEAKTYKDNAKIYMDDAKTYMDNAKNYSENVNVFVPSVSSAGVLSWTNKAGLTNPKSVNIKGAKGDKGDKGEKGDTGTITVDAELSDTSTNPIQNKAIYKALLGKAGTDIFTGFALIEATATIAWRQGTQMIGTINATNYSGMARTALRDGESNVITETYAKKDTVNEWGAQQNFQQVLLAKEKYLSSVQSGTSSTPTLSVIEYTPTGAFTIDLSKIVASLEVNNATVFTAYIKSSADYPLTITNAGTLKYVGSASDVAITSAGLLLNIMMLKDASGNVTSIVQASKLEGGA